MCEGREAHELEGVQDRGRAEMLAWTLKCISSIVCRDWWSMEASLGLDVLVGNTDIW